MSQENMDVVRRIYDAYARGDFEEPFSYFDPDVEWREPPHSPGAQVYRGPDGARRSMRNWFGAWEDYRLDLEHLVDAGDAVLAVTRQTVRGKSSGVVIEQRLFVAWTLRDRKVIRMRMYHDKSEALEAVGLRE